ncbi:hypothetical protein ALC60_00216 [Trachymyrmex zeteki]|uniref:Endonuclease/exonuclease/phosphatase domain-containing protein n=1 Tax=Mycetomoellerius zeteki TaxID=64791 RepID=A0A151XK93_9HYME|nr:hypothetical protein ALC60_00216 [Trachymyrmex zeteki]
MATAGKVGKNKVDNKQRLLTENYYYGISQEQEGKIRTSYVEEYDFVSLSETWLDEKGWNAMKDRLPKTHEWACSYARKEKKRGRAKGGFIIGKRIGWGNKEDRSLIRKEGSSVIELALINDSGNAPSIYDSIVEFRIDARVESDHMPICLILEERINEGSVENGAEEDKEEEDNGIKEEIIIWNKEVIESYKKNTEIIKDMANDIRNEGKDVEDIIENRVPNYLRTENIEWRRGDEIRALIKLRCGNMEEKNKYWLGKEERTCLFCDKDEDNLEHYVKECKEVSGCFEELGIDNDEIIKKVWDEDLGESKGKALKKLWKDRERRIIKRKEKIEAGMNRDREKNLETRKKCKLH